MHVLNLVDTTHPVNAGIWRAALATASRLQARFGVTSEVWFPGEEPFAERVEYPGLRVLPLVDHSASYLNQLADGLPADTVVVSHGAWQYPTRWGHALRRRGFRWVYVPHGMLEPWGMAQKKLKKQLYFRAVERPRAARADAVRAVSSPERDNLKKHFTNVHLIPNGVNVDDIFSVNERANERDQGPVTVLFMARLHHKKGVLPLVRAWTQSVLYQNPAYQLCLAGPDDGELAPLLALLQQLPAAANVRYVGTLSGAAKDDALRRATFYVLPSYSEGFPTSVLEAMGAGLVPLVSEGCNFPELFAQQLALKVSPREDDIRAVLNALPALTGPVLANLARRNRAFVAQDYSLDRIAEAQMSLYSQLLDQKLAR